MKNTTDNPLRYRAAIPHVIVILWLIYLGTMIWRHNVQSVQPPYYDPLSYMQKAKNFWEAVDHGKLFNPLNIEPTIRPPGTILMSYPFGFSSDFKGFHFRSVFVPILCIVLAVYMAAGLPKSSAESWGIAAVAILFSAIPIFYDFDHNDLNSGSTHWGLVDNFQAGIAALAAAGFVKSLKARSLIWLMWGAFCGSFTLMIKPSGLMIMALLTATWLIVVILEYLWARTYQQTNSDIQRYVIIGGIQTFTIFSVVVLLCIFSNYFSMQNFTYAKQAMIVMREVLKTSPLVIILLLFRSIGIAFALWILWKGSLIIYNYFSSSDRHEFFSATMIGLLLSTPVIWNLGIWYWLVVQSGGNQVRYFYPFLLMGAVCMIPMSLHVLQRSHRWIRLAELVLCFLPALNIGTLLALESPPILWQQITGVNVFVGKDREEVNQAYTFLDVLRSRNMSANLYSFVLYAPANTFVTIGIYEEIVRPHLPVFKLISPVDWLGGFCIRTNQFLDADYILVSNDSSRILEMICDQQIFFPRLFDQQLFDQHFALVSESVVFQTWLCGLNESAGVKTVSDGMTLRLLEIIDRKAFAYAVESFVATHSWRPEFIAANSLRRWWNEADVSGYAGNFVAKKTDFEGIYTLHALSLLRTDTGLKVELWWEELRHEDANSQRLVFFHLVDQSGKILHNLSLSLDKYDPPFDNRRWRYGTITFEQPLSNEATSLAFGIFRPNHEFLMPDKGVCDWGGMRVLVPIPVNDS